MRVSLRLPELVGEFWWSVKQSIFFLELAELPVDMPTYVALHVQLKSLARELERFLLALLTIQDQPFHSQCLPVLRELFENSIGRFDAFLVLLSLIMSYDLPE